jgi:hypothetical protein
MRHMPPSTHLKALRIAAFATLAATGINSNTQAQPFEIETLSLTSVSELSRGETFVLSARAGSVTDTPAAADRFALDSDWAPPLIEAPLVAPTNPVRIKRVTLTPVGISLSFASTAGRQYVLQSRDDIASGSWSDVPGATKVGTGESLEILLSDVLSSTQRFYRIQILP